VIRRAPRSTRAKIVQAEADQRATADLLYQLGQGDLAARLLGCMAAKQARRGGDGRVWLRRCGSAACRWCSRTRQHAGWFAALDWSRGHRRSLAAISIRRRPGQIGAAIRRLRRGLRDVRDRMARSRRRWRSVGIAGVVAGGAVWLVVLHPDVERGEVNEVLRRRWPDAAVRDVDEGAVLPEPLGLHDAVALALVPRGVDYLRVVVGLRHDDGVRHHHRAVEDIEPMPITF